MTEFVPGTYYNDDDERRWYGPWLHAAQGLLFYAHGPADCRYVQLSLLFSMRKARNRLWLLACTTLGVLGNYRILKEIA